MVVLVIIGLMASVVVVSLPDPRPSAPQEADRLAAKLRRAHEEAILANRAVEIVVTEQGYSFQQRTGGGWRALDERPFQPGSWNPGVGVEVIGGGDRVAFDPTGLATAAHLRVSRDGRQADVRVDEAGNVQIDAPRL